MHDIKNERICGNSCVFGRTVKHFQLKKLIKYIVLLADFYIPSN